MISVCGNMVPIYRGHVDTHHPTPELCNTKLLNISLRNS